MNVDKVARLMLLHTMSLWGFIGSILLAIAAATELRPPLGDMVVPAAIMLMLTAWLMFNLVLAMLGAHVGKSWVGWLAVSVLFGPAGMLIAYFSARRAAQDAIALGRSSGNSGAVTGP